MNRAASTIAEALAPLQNFLSELEQLSAQAAVHRKKFEYSVSQFRRFCQIFANSSIAPQLTDKQGEAHRSMLFLLRELRDLVAEHQLQTWAHLTLENPSNYVASALTTLAGKFRSAAESLDPSSAPAFDPDAPQWLQYHLLDLKGISASFHQYLKACKPEDPVIPLMRERLNSVDTFIQTYDKENVAPGLRVFSPIPVHYQSWRLNYDDLEILHEIGSGVSANVFYGKDRRSGAEVAIKKLKFKKLAGSNLQAFQREVGVLASVSHPALLGFIGATDSPPFCIVTEWMAGGTLYTEIHKQKKLNATQLTIAAFDIARGMQFLHSLNIIHRDLKSLNVLFNENGRAHICDFGFSRHAGGEEALMTQNVGTPHWMAPELLNSNTSYTSKVDVYAYGLVLWEIVSRQVPFSGLEPAQILVQVFMNDIRPVIPDHVNVPLRDLIKQCWDRNPDVRPTFDEIVDRFVTDKIVVDGADVAEFERYVEETVGTGGSAWRSFEAKLTDGSFDTDESLLELIESIERGDVPPNLIMRCWEVLEVHAPRNPALASRAACLFLSGPAKIRAARLLRRLPCNSIAPSVLASVIVIIPTGSEDFDRDLIIASCKNGAADIAAIYAILPSNIKLCLEIVAQHGADVTLKAAVADKCVQSLGSRDLGLVCAAMRCLVGMGESRRIRPNIILQHVASDQQYLRFCGLVAATAMALSGTELDAQIIDAVMEGPDDAVAETFLASACYPPHSALQVVNRIAYGQRYNAQLILKIFLMAARHEELRPAIMIALQRVDLSCLQDEWGRELEQLTALVNR
jgi:serine/threonine protein kinase